MKIYLDSCILISYFSKHKEERKNKKIINKTIKLMEKIEDLEIFISSWGIAEMMNVMLSRQKQKNAFVLKCESMLLGKKRIGNLKLKVLEIGGNNKNYDFGEFFYDIREIILKYHPGVGDTIHSVIMKNNDINHILTFNESDFEDIEGITVLNPNGVKLIKEK
ncbi:MAG: PIN domain-containing protein [Nanoarchaeota archaeon]|nr:PIN domain-containing protein [Nanoarchaeota archaeon]